MRKVILLATFVSIIIPNIGAKTAKECWIENENLPHETIVISIIELRNCDDNYNVDCGSLESNHNEKINDIHYIQLDEHTNMDSLHWKLENSERSLDSDSDAIVSYVDLDVTTFPSECPENADPYEEATLLPHEKMCNAFYKCFKGKKYSMSCPGIPENKLKHLQELQPYIDENSRVYYSQFINTLTVSSTAIDTIMEEEDDIYDDIDNHN
ncbi:hypothetical protein JTB14_015627 [Gonioctena quinquepunctata]|nr:hypothetical protein JTB14_015627 [Gonioctena quinquepunctata]